MIRFPSATFKVFNAERVDDSPAARADENGEAAKTVTLLNTVSKTVWRAQNPFQTRSSVCWRALPII